MKYFLTEIVEERGISVQEWRDGVGVAESTARWHLKAKPPRIPEPKCWDRIARFLKLSRKEVERMFRQELEAQGRILGCQVCKKEILQFSSRKYLCGSIDCLREYDRKRKASQRKKVHKWKRLNENDFANIANRGKNTRQITQTEIDSKVKDFIKGGGVIQHLNPTIADGIAGEAWNELYSARQTYRYKIDIDY